MPQVDVKKNQTRKGEQGRPQPTPDRERPQASPAEGQGGPLSRRGFYAPSFFSLSPRELGRSSPFELMRRFTDELDRAFEGFGWGAGTTGRWAPPVEAFEREGKFVVRAELPGLNRDDVKVEVTDEGLIIKGERKSEHEERREGFYRSEWSYGQFHRLVPLPYENADVDQARAQFENGVLEVTIPVPEGQESRRRQIPVQTGGGEQRPALSGGKGRG